MNQNADYGGHYPDHDHGMWCATCNFYRDQAAQVTEVVATAKMRLNSEPLKVVSVPRCRKCGMRAPWCKCVDGADYGAGQ